MLTGMFQNGTYQLLGQFTAFKYVFQVFCDSWSLYIKKLCHFFLSQPDGFVLENRVDFDLTVFGGVEDDFGLVGRLGHFCCFLNDSTACSIAFSDFSLSHSFQSKHSINRTKHLVSVVRKQGFIIFARFSHRRLSNR